MLKSTYKTASPPLSQGSVLPIGWTEHKAPTGHSYYYNAETKQSTYTRPTAPSPSPFINRTTVHSPLPYGRGQSAYGSGPSNDPDHAQSFRSGRSYQDRSRRQQHQDRPKKKKEIPGCKPWILVTTKLGRRFVYNPEKNESFWKFPQDVLLATFEMDREDQKGKDNRERQGPETAAKAEPGRETPPTRGSGDPNKYAADGGDTYEEVEVTDDEDADAGDYESDGGHAKKQRRESAHQKEPSGPVEFDEEDIAYQLAQMGEDYGLDPGEYGEGEENGHDAGLPLSVEDCRALFYDLLSDHGINPYTTWEKIIEEGRIVDDERYVVLPNMRARKEAFTSWSKEQIQSLKDKRAKEEKKDPRILYLRFLQDHATPKLYWPEFKRKYRKEDIMKDIHLSDKDREKMYRDHINRLKLPESTRKTDLKELLNTIPLQQLHRNSTLDTLPAAVLTDPRSTCLPSQVRDPLIEAFISTLPFPPPPSSAAPPHSPNAGSEDPSEADRAEGGKSAAEREKRERALRQREKTVHEEKRRALGALRHGKEILREEEKEIEEALRVRGRDGLMGYMMEGLGD